MFDQSGGGPPNQGHLRMLKPPVPVWVDLAKVYPVPASAPAILAEGLDLRSTVPGLLQMWDRATTGHWVGWTVFSIGSSIHSARVGQWVLQDALTPREATAGRQQIASTSGV